MEKSLLERRPPQPVKKGLSSLIRDQRGSILIEFTLTISVLMVIFLAAITFSLLFAEYYGVQKVAREGAKEASITKNIGWAESKAKQSAQLWGLDPSKMQINFSTGSQSVTCHVTYIATPMNKTFPTLLDRERLTDVNLSSKATYAWFDGG